MRDPRHVSASRRLAGSGSMTRMRVWILFACFLALIPASPLFTQGAAPVIVVETSKGSFAFETYPEDAPKTVKHIVDLVRAGFYDGQRFHRVVPGFVAQWGDPQTRDVT